MKKICVMLMTLLMSALTCVSASAASVSGNPATGDISKWVPFMIGGIAAVVLIVVMIALGMKKGKKDDDDDFE